MSSRRSGRQRVRWMATPSSADLAPDLVAALRVRAAPALTAELNARFGRALREPAVWVTQLTDPRTAFYRLRHPIPAAPEAEARMARGRHWHDVIEQRLADPPHREVRVARDGIIGQLDLFVDRPIELKTTSSSLPADRWAVDRPEYIDQLAMYCALTERPSGRLVVISERGPSVPPAVTVLDCDFRDQDALTREMRSAAARFRNALLADDPTGLPSCPWFQRGCAYRAAGVCRCDGNESEDTLAAHRFLAGIRQMPAAEAEIAEILGRAAPAPLGTELGAYRELVYLRRAYFDRTARSTTIPPASAELSGQAAVRSMYQLLREALDNGPAGDVASAAAPGEAPAEPVTLLRREPILLKTSRARRPPAPDELAGRHPWYFLELGLRCAAFGAAHGWIVVGYESLPERDGPLRAFRVDFEPIGVWEAELHRRADRLRSAIAGGRPEELPGCPDWMREDCPYLAHCGEGGERVQR